MPATLVDDQLWELIQPLLPRKARRYRHPGRRRIDDRKVPQNPTRVAVLMEVPDMDAVMAAMQTEAAAEAMAHDGVLADTLVILVEA